MSTEAEVNSQYPFYVNFYLHDNSINDFGQYTLNYSEGKYTIVSWGYLVSEPTMMDLQTYTYVNVMTFADAIDKINMLNGAETPIQCIEDEEIAMGEIGGIRDGSIIFETTQNKLYIWHTDGWHALAYET